MQLYPQYASIVTCFDFNPAAYMETSMNNDIEKQEDSVVELKLEAPEENLDLEILQISN